MPLLLLIPSLFFSAQDEGRGISAAQATAAFDQLWAEMDRHYSYFEHKKIDWNALREKYRPQAATAKDVASLAAVLQRMLKELKDVHIWIDTPKGRLATHPFTWERNWSSAGIKGQLASVEAIGKFAAVGKLKNGYGYLVLENQGAATQQLVAQTVARIESLGEVPGFIVDLRAGATGGNEAVARPLAAAFCDKEVVYAKSQFRSGPKHTDFGPAYERRLTAGKRPFTKPVVVLLGSRVLSSGEGLAKMFAVLPNVTTVGSPTGGGSGNPKPVELKEVGITVWFSRWVDMLPDGTPIEGRGVLPQVPANYPSEAFAASDPVLDKGIAVLKAKLAESKR